MDSVGVANDAVDQAVIRVIEAMYRRIGEELTADDLARTAMYSKFHFSRVFRQVTGVSPGRFLSVLRFQEAKRLLASTSLSVAEISNRVGYSSLGTFSTRFKSSVGVTPTGYRRGGWSTSKSALPARTGDPCRTVHGEVTAVAQECGVTFVGLFPDSVPHRPPVRFTVLARPGRFVLGEVPEGNWYLVVHAGAADPPAADPPGGSVHRDLAGLVGRLGPITVRPGEVNRPADVSLRPMRAVDLPALLAPFVTRPHEAGPWSMPPSGGYGRFGGVR